MSFWNKIYVLFLPDADGDYQITSRSKAQIRYDGVVKWVCLYYRTYKIFYLYYIESSNDL